MSSAELFKGKQLGGRPFVHFDIPREVYPIRSFGPAGYGLDIGVSLVNVINHIRGRLEIGSAIKHALEMPQQYAFRGVTRFLGLDYLETIKSIEEKGIDFNRLGRSGPNGEKKFWFEPSYINYPLSKATPLFDSEVGLLIVSRAKGLVWPDNFEEAGNSLEEGSTLKQLHVGTVQIAVSPPMQDAR
jgi:hypothetical protein